MQDQKYQDCDKCTKNYAVIQIENNETEPSTKLALCKVCAGIDA